MPIRGKRFYRLHNYLLVAPPNVEKKRGKLHTKSRRGLDEPRSMNLGNKLTKKKGTKFHTIYVGN